MNVRPLHDRLIGQRIDEGEQNVQVLGNRYADTVVLMFAEIEDLLVLRFRTKRASTKSAGRTQRST